jgi:hypothetical protein
LAARTTLPGMTSTATNVARHRGGKPLVECVPQP